MDLDTLTYQRTTIDGRPHWLFGDGTLLPVISGGDGPTGDGGGDSGQGGQGGDGDGGQGSGGDAGDGSQGDGQGSEGAAAAKGDKSVTMSQAELNDMIEKRIAKARKGWDDEAKTKAEREKLDEVERLKAEKADAESAGKAATDRANARLVAAEARVAAVAAGVNPERIDRFMKLVDLSEVEVNDDGVADVKAARKAVDAALKDVPEFKADSKSGPGRSGGEMNGGGGKEKPKSLEDAVAARYAG